MPQWVTEKVFEALNESNRPIKGSRILIVGVAYKKNVEDVRESPSIAIMKLLQGRGAVLSYSDPHVPKIPVSPDENFPLSSETLTPEFIKSQDCVVIATDHDAIDYKMLLENAHLIVDTRGRYLEGSSKVIRA